MFLRQGTAVLKMGKRRSGNRIRGGGLFLGLFALSSLSLGFAAWVVPIQGVAQDVGVLASFGATSALSFLKFGTPEVPYVYEDSSSLLVIEEDAFTGTSTIRVPFLIDHRLAHAGGYVDEGNRVFLRFTLEAPSSIVGIDNPPVARSNVSAYPFQASSSEEHALVSEGSVVLLSEQATGESAYVLEYTVHDAAAGILLEGTLSLEAFAL